MKETPSEPIVIHAVECEWPDGSPVVLHCNMCVHYMTNEQEALGAYHCHGNSGTSRLASSH